MHEYHIDEVKKVTDGDTITVVLDLGFGIFKTERMRLENVDTPESMTSDLREKALGMAAKEFVKGWLAGQSSLWCKTSKDDKYGRTLALVYGDGGACINDILIERGLAWRYDGGTKEKNLDTLVEQQQKWKEENP